MVCKKCKDFLQKRVIATAKIIESKKKGNPLILIVAGPGTGKTYTFTKVIESIGRNKKILAFTLINNLAYELAKDFESSGFKNIEATTFHGYCKKLLYRGFGYRGKYFPDLPVLIESDAKFLELKFTKDNFHEAFANLNRNSALKFYLKRAKYYKTLGYDSSVYKVYKKFLSDNNTIPSYDLVIADEYQDFNKLEASLINLLIQKSPVLIAGDDDQALYGFRHASTKYIRNLHKNPKFKKFNLPFSSRCTDVLVDSVNSIIEKSKKLGLLKGRIEEKDYISYWPDKYLLDKQYPVIKVTHCSKPETAKLFIKLRIENIVTREKLTGKEKDIQFLIIGSSTQHRLNLLAKYLEANLNPKHFKVEIKKGEKEALIEKGFLEIHRENKSNLGWRIILHNNQLKEIKKIVQKSYETDRPIFDLLPKKYKEKYLLKAEEYFSENDDQPNEEIEEVGENGDKKIRVKLTTYLGAKGLSALHVIVQEFHNGVLPEDKTGTTLLDEDICKLIVSITRAKRSCSLVTFKEYDRKTGKSINKPSSLLKMFPDKNLVRYACKIKTGKLICSRL